MNGHEKFHDNAVIFGGTLACPPDDEAIWYVNMKSTMVIFR
jgi:hypothetical protein